MNRKLLVFALVCCLLSLFGLTLPAAAEAPRPLIIDSDMTNDDFMATLFLLNRPEFSLKAITVTGTGWGYCDAGVRAALGMVALANYGDVPVSCWTETPLLGGENPVPPEYRTNLDAVNALNLPEGGKPSDMDAVELFTATVEASPDKITVLALGPLTNIAQAFLKTPTLVDKIERITIMGGAVDVGGSPVSDENKTAEWNIYCDPPAARIVFESGVPITLVGLDATDLVPITLTFLKQIQTEKKTPAAELVATLLENSKDFIQSGFYYFWDQLAAAVLVDPSLVTLTERNISVVDIPGADYGRTQPVGNGSRIMVATNPDAPTFKQLLIDTWNAGG